MQNKNIKTEDTLDILICALCKDYERREEIIRSGTAARRVDTELRYINYKMRDAAAEISGDELSEIFIAEIGGRRGYAISEADYISETTYKNYKKLIKENIAKSLYLK